MGHLAFMVTDLGIEWGLNPGIFHILSKDESLCLPQFTASTKNVAQGPSPTKNKCSFDLDF